MIDKLPEWTDEEINALLSYKNNPFDLNTSLQNGMSLTSAQLELCSLWDSAIGKHKSPDQLVLYRGCDWNIISQFINQCVLVYPAYFSTSIRLSIAQSFLPAPLQGVPALLTFECPSGSHLAPMEVLPGAGGDEFEYLIGRNKRFEISAYRQQKDPHVIDQVFRMPHTKGHLIIHELELKYVLQ